MICTPGTSSEVPSMSPRLMTAMFFLPIVSADTELILSLSYLSRYMNLCSFTTSTLSMILSSRSVLSSLPGSVTASSVRLMLLRLSSTVSSGSVSSGASCLRFSSIDYFAPRKASFRLKESVSAQQGKR